MKMNKFKNDAKLNCVKSNWIVLKLREWVDGYILECAFYLKFRGLKVYNIQVIISAGGKVVVYMKRTHSHQQLLWGSNLHYITGELISYLSLTVTGVASTPSC
jgi:hypothetical protein